MVSKAASAAVRGVDFSAARAPRLNKTVPTSTAARTRGFPILFMPRISSSQPQRQLAQALPRQGEDGVRHRRRDGRRAGLAGAAGFFTAGDDVDFHLPDRV